MEIIAECDESGIFPVPIAIGRDYKGEAKRFEGATMHLQASGPNPIDPRLLAAHARLEEALKLLDETGLLHAAACLSSTLDIIHREFPQLSASR
jgi:hypothetical protein